MVWEDIFVVYGQKGFYLTLGMCAKVMAVIIRYILKCRRIRLLDALVDSYKQWIGLVYVPQTCRKSSHWRQSPNAFSQQQ
jgi:hypothetical protein